MALSRPVTGQTHIQDVDVNGLDRFYYASRRSKLTVGTEVELRAQPNNLVDRDAVEVRFGGVQIGWVPRAQNGDIARRLRNGQKLVARILRHNLAAHDLRLSVFVDRGLPVVESAPGTAPKPLDTITITGRPMQNPDSFYEIDTYAAGTAFPLVTSFNRVSITLTDPARTKDLAWFRKSEISEAAVEAAERGNLVAVKRSDGKFDLSESSNYLRIDGSMLATCGITSDRIISGTINFNLSNYTTKEATMKNIATNLIDSNKSAAAQAGFLEAGRIANNQLVRVSAKTLPLMVRGYADTPVGKLVLANVAQLAATQLRPSDPTLAKLTTAMTVAAYQELIQTFDIEGWLNQILESPEIKRAVSKLDPAPATATE